MTQKLPTLRHSPNVRVEPIVGRYLHLELSGVAHRVYVEEAGEGVPLLCLHTAGSDTRQYRGLMNDPELIKNYRIIAFDLPWHGKSSPPEGSQGVFINYLLGHILRRFLP